MNFEFNNSNFSFLVAAFYCFKPISNDHIVYFLEHLPIIAKSQEVKGTVLVAEEGVNGTICGSVTGIRSILEILQKGFQENGLELKFSWTHKQAFRRFKARRKKEIVTMGIPEINPLELVGDYVEPRDWNDFLKSQDTLIIDARNSYEVGIGTFDGALNPNTDSFREFPKWVDNFLIPLLDQELPKKIGLFCTGGIRCEKATSYLKKVGIKQVHHLHGGVLRYLEEISQEQSLWNGECFVFDQRVALTHKLLPGDYALCFACGMPLSLNDRSNHRYIPGVQCSYCEGSFTDEDRNRFAERQKQFDKTNQERRNGINLS